MIVLHEPAVHLTYCTNIHAGESWEEILANVATHVVAVKARVAPDRRFGVGLRLSAAAAETLAQPAVLESFREFLDDRGLYVFTINGFPHGRFHGTAVKEQVYRPDWLEDERLAYTDRLAQLLAQLLPRDKEFADLGGSVSTVPGCFRARGDLRSVGPAIARRMLQHAAYLFHLQQSTGRNVSLAIEPEPACVMETIPQTVEFFTNELFCKSGVAQFARLTGLGAAASESFLRDHIGVCFDACHAAVEFEDPVTAVGALTAAGIRIAKIQVSAGLVVAAGDSEAKAALAPFAEGVYLHQTVISRAGELQRFDDLPAALSATATGDPGDEWRVHFHVPLFRSTLGPFSNTQPFLRELLALVAREKLCQHLEVETYTWDVLPAEFRREPVDDAIARELAWTLAALGVAP